MQNTNSPLNPARNQSSSLKHFQLLSSLATCNANPWTLPSWIIPLCELEVPRENLCTISSPICDLALGCMKLQFLQPCHLCNNLHVEMAEVARVCHLKYHLLDILNLSRINVFQQVVAASDCVLVERKIDVVWCFQDYVVGCVVGFEAQKVGLVGS